MSVGTLLAVPAAQRAVPPRDPAERRGCTTCRREAQARARGRGVRRRARARSRRRRGAALRAPLAAPARAAARRGAAGDRARRSCRGSRASTATACRAPRSRRSTAAGRRACRRSSAATATSGGCSCSSIRAAGASPRRSCAGGSRASSAASARPSAARLYARRARPPLAGAALGGDPERPRLPLSGAARRRGLAELGVPVWRYLFSWRPPLLGGRLGAGHGMELPFVFGTLRDGDPAPHARRVARRAAPLAPDAGRLDRVRARRRAGPRAPARVARLRRDRARDARFRPRDRADPRAVCVGVGVLAAAARVSRDAYRRATTSRRSAALDPRFARGGASRARRWRRARSPSSRRARAT